MTDFADFADFDPPEPLDPYTLYDQFLSNAVADLSEVAAKCGNITDPAELWQLIERVRLDVAPALKHVESELTLLAFQAIQDQGGEMQIGEHTIEAAWSSPSRQWDSPRLIDKLVQEIPASCYEDSNRTVEAWEAAQRGFKLAVKCLGGETQSASWRSSFIEKLGLDLNLGNYYETRPGSSKRRVGVKQPRPQRSRTADSGGEAGTEPPTVPAATDEAA